MTTPQDLNQSIRQLLEVVRTANLDAVDNLSALQAQIDDVRGAIAPAVVDEPRMQAALSFAPGMMGPPEGAFDDPNAYFPYSPVLGALNPVSPVANFDVVDGQIRGQVTMGSVYNGPPSSVHGGMIALVLDELLGCTCLAYGVGGFTGTLNIRYQGLVPLDTPVDLHGWVEREEGRKVFAKGQIRLGDQVLTAAEGIFIRPKEGS